MIPKCNNNCNSWKTQASKFKLEGSQNEELTCTYILCVRTRKVDDEKHLEKARNDENTSPCFTMRTPFKRNSPERK